MAHSENVILTNMCLIEDNQGKIVMQIRDPKRYSWSGAALPGGECVKKEGLIFIPSRNLDIHESEQGKSYHVFIRETAQFFIYNKENSDLNRYMRGRELIRQLSQNSKHIPKRRRLARHDYAKMNLASTVKLEQVIGEAGKHT